MSRITVHILRSDAYTRSAYIEVTEPESGPVVCKLHETSADGFSSYERVISVAEALAYLAQMGVAN